MHITSRRRFPERIPQQEGRKTMMKITVVKFGLLAGCLMFAGTTHALEQEKENGNPASVAQIVALDECDRHLQRRAWA